MHKQLFLLSAFFLSSIVYAQEPSAENNQQEESSFPLGGDLSLGLDFFRSLPQGSWQGSFGSFGSIQLAYALPKQKEGLGVQAGYSFGAYDWTGNGNTNSKSVLLQNFVTVGLFRKEPRQTGLNAGIVYDWMIADNYGVFGLSPTMSQVRGQLGILIRKHNEIGVEATYATQTDHELYQALPISFRAISQLNGFWRYFFKNTAEAMVWGGVPYRKGLLFGSGKAGYYILGTSLKAPLNNFLSIDGHGVYMGGRGDSASNQSKDYAANACLALTYSFGGRKPGARPYLPLANNSNFLVDTNLNY